MNVFCRVFVKGLKEQETIDYKFIITSVKIAGELEQFKRVNVKRKEMRRNSL